MAINIIGSKSSKGSISILSDEFIATATMGETGTIACKTAPLSKALKKLLQPDTRFMPKTLKFLLFLKETMSRKDLALIGALALAILLMELSAESVSGDSAIIEKYSWIIILSGLTIAGGMVRLSIASWHGAEHMAIAAYDRSEATSLEAMEKESPVNPKCGTRMAFPLIVVQNIVFRAAGEYFAQDTLISFVGTIILFLVSIECVLWADSLFGFDNLPITGKVSGAIQKYVVTKQPGTGELRTAQMAMRHLIAAHEKLAV